jgi:hypothetical protein
MNLSGLVAAALLSVMLAGCADPAADKEVRKSVAPPPADRGAPDAPPAASVNPQPVIPPGSPPPDPSTSPSAPARTDKAMPPGPVNPG